MNNLLRMIVGFLIVMLGITGTSMVESSDLISIFFFLVIVILGIGLFAKGLSLIPTEGLITKRDALVSQEVAGEKQ